MNRVNYLGPLMVVLALVLGLGIVAAVYQWENDIRSREPGLFGEASPVPTSPAASPTVVVQPPPTEPAGNSPTATPVAGQTPLPTATTAAGSTPTATDGSPAPTATAPAVEAVSFQKDILPIFQKSCGVCHGALGGLSLKDYNSLMTTGTNKPQVVPGNPEGSLLFRRLTTQAPLMPPGQALPQEQVQKIAQWIRDGAANN